MKIFETGRLIIKGLETVDIEYFRELFTDPNVLKAIPQNPFTESQITERFDKSLNLTLSNLQKQKCACGIFEKGNPHMIGLALFLFNEKNEQELGYRFRESYWGKGYGTETTQGMLTFYFKTLHATKVMADVNIANIASVKILDKFMTPVKEFFNERDNCTDRRYELKREDWLQQNSNNVKITS